LRAVQREPATANGVWGSKMMWSYLPDAVARLRAWPRLDAGAADPEVLAAAFPGLRYVWLRRRDKLRQAISWWRAAATGQYALAASQVAAEPPEFDHDAIGRLLWLAQASEAGWRDWFAAHSIKPLQIVYEDLIQDVDGAARNVAGFLDVPLPPGLEQIRPRLRRQADQHTEHMVRLFNRYGEG
jgi:trehalose 2-sulfotransferase